MKKSSFERSCCPLLVKFLSYKLQAPSLAASAAMYDDENRAIDLNHHLPVRKLSLLQLQQPRLGRGGLGLQFRRVWIQGHVCSLDEDNASATLDDGSASIQIMLNSFSPPRLGAYVMAIGGEAEV